MRTRRSMSIASCFACAPSTRRWRTITSTIWSPMVNAGFSDVIGSWKIIEMRSPRRSRIASAGSSRRLRPSKLISPPAMRPGGCGISPMIDSAVTLLPQPDSPTMPSVRPDSTLKLTSSTARSSAPSTRKLVRRLRTSSNAVMRDRSRDARPCRLVARDRRLHFRTIGDPPRPCLAGQAREHRLVALEALFVQAQQFADRLVAVVDADVEERIALARVNEQRGRLLASLVAARLLAGGERGDEPQRKRNARVGFVGPRRRGDDLRPGEHVPRDRIVHTLDVAAPLDALRTGVGRRVAVAIDDVKLAVI